MRRHRELYNKQLKESFKALSFLELVKACCSDGKSQGNKRLLSALLLLNQR